MENDSRKRQDLKTAALRAVRKTMKSFRSFLPLLLGTVFAIGLLVSLLPKELYGRAFPGNPVFDPLIGAALGAVSAGNAMFSYVIGGELLGQGVSLLAVAAFLTTWVTVGFIQIPAESMLLGRRFTLARNGVAFVAALLSACCLSLIVS